MAHRKLEEITFSSTGCGNDYMNGAGAQVIAIPIGQPIAAILMDPKRAYREIRAQAIEQGLWQLANAYSATIKPNRNTSFEGGHIMAAQLYYI